MINVHSLFKHNKLRPVAIGRNEQPATGLVLYTPASLPSRRPKAVEKLHIHFAVDSCKVNCSRQRHCSQVTHNRMGNDAQPTAEFNSIYTLMRLCLKLIRSTSIINYIEVK